MGGVEGREGSGSVIERRMGETVRAEVGGGGGRVEEVDGDEVGGCGGDAHSFPPDCFWRLASLAPAEPVPRSRWNSR